MSLPWVRRIENSYYGDVKNPWNVNKIPGGSSGGSAAAVAGRLAPFATGTDTRRLDSSTFKSVWYYRTKA
jgi:aspartyl/glutamyl-tRNA(Asn/Gln) amidotransferase subunit A (EC 6.3.5.-)